MKDDMDGNGRSRPIVSVVMNCFNCSEYIRESIETVLAQQFEDWEVVFWDNRSTDASASVFCSYTDERLRYFLAPEHTSLGHARNLALEKVSGDFIAFLDCDDLWRPEYLTTLLPMFSSSERVGLVYANALWFNEKGTVKRSIPKGYLFKGQCFGKLLTRYRLSMSAVILRKRALDELDHVFDPQFRVLEEADLFRRIAYFWELDYVDLPLALWRSSGQSESWVNYERFAEEGELMLQKFSECIPEFDRQYSVETRAYRAIIARRRAISQWARGERLSAGKILSPFAFLDLKNTLLLIALALPFSFYATATNRLRLMATPLRRED